ncbi:hypothetical protein FDP41_003981 [Naegleria fowleri]|uniref:Uncharacterized protein n=1 Tax=Naegleria fowleri TaxID=5763 RepID=A0A6A5BNX7_NAEFO|nr:uncharacterized protein FDP41_003981 [Naegleria fowleri]KAF0976686.1 hypothetical protein FDP41_003981 [Naegleria fowleri]
MPGLLQAFESKFGDHLIFQDHYTTIIELPPNIKANTGTELSVSRNNKTDGIHDNDSTMTTVDVSHFARSFFTSNLFYLESRLLKMREPSYGNTEPEEINQLKFQIGDNVSMFKVIEQTENEILMRTPIGTVEWFKISKPQQQGKTDDGSSVNKIQISFGSGVLANEPLAKSPLFRVSMPFTVYFRNIWSFKQRPNLKR